MRGFSGREMHAMASPGNNSKSKDLLAAQLPASLEVIPAYAWYLSLEGPAERSKPLSANVLWAKG